MDGGEAGRTGASAGLGAAIEEEFDLMEILRQDVAGDPAKQARLDRLQEIEAQLHVCTPISIYP